MAFVPHVLRREKLESPAKVFARLKCKVRREAAEGRRGSARSPWKTTAKDQDPHRTYREEALALTFSPISSPRKAAGDSCLSPEEEEVPPETEALLPRRRGRAFLESTSMSHTGQIHRETPHSRDLLGQIHRETPHSRDLLGQIHRETPHSRDLLGQIHRETPHSRDLLGQIHRETPHSRDLLGQIHRETPHSRDLLGQIHRETPHSRDLLGQIHRETPHSRDLLGQIHRETPHSRDLLGQIHRETPHSRDLLGQIHRETPHNRTKTVGRQKELNSEFSPIRGRLRKRKLEPCGLNKSKAGARRDSRASAASEDDDTHNNNNRMDGGDPSQEVVDSILPPRRSLDYKGCSVELETCTMKSPAKMFAFMKERDAKKQPNQSERNLFKNDDSVGEAEDTTFTGTLVGVTAVKSSQSEAHPFENETFTAVQSQPVLRERICEEDKNLQKIAVEQHRPAFISPRKKAGKNTWMTDELKENQKVASHCKEDFTLSPTPGPQKVGWYYCSDLSMKPEEGTETETSTAPIRDLGRSKVSSRTPVKTQLTEDGLKKSVFDEEGAPLKKSASPLNVFRFRQRKPEQQKFNSVVSRDEVVNSDLLKQRKASAVGEDEGNINAPLRDLGGGGLSAAPSTALQSARSTVEKHFTSDVDRCSQVTPFKICASMKEKKNKKELLLGIPDGDTFDLFSDDLCQQSKDSPASTSHSVGEVVPALQPQPVLLEDSLVLNSPQISIPQKSEVVLRRNRWPNQAKFPSESVVYLRRWFLRRNSQGLFIDGINRDENLHWNSNIIVERVSNSVLKTVSGRVYILVGKMRMDVPSDFPMWFLKKFAGGFPSKWKELYEKFLSESKDQHSRGKARNRGSKGRATTATPDGAAPHCFKAPVSCSSTSTKVSRSGRVIKPPLEFWKGGRVMLDAHMNVTIHEDYETSFCYPDSTTMLSERDSIHTQDSILRPYREGAMQTRSSSQEEMLPPLRKVKLPVYSRGKKKEPPAERASRGREAKEETQRILAGRRGRGTKSSKTCPGGEVHEMEDVPQTHSVSEDASKSSKQTLATNRPPATAASRRPNTTKPSSACEEPSQLPSLDEDVVVRRKKNSNSRGKAPPKSHPDLESSDETWKPQKKRNETRGKINAAQAQNKQSKCNKTSPPSSTQTSRNQKAKRGNAATQQEPEEDKWTETELQRLQDAALFYPRNLGGYWEKVAWMVGTRSAEECYNQHTSLETTEAPAARTKKSRKKEQAPSVSVAGPVISARVGTLKRKQQVRQFLEAMPKDNMEDFFTSASIHNKRAELPSLCPSDDHDFSLTDLEPLTPKSSALPEARTPQCLHLSPGMITSPSRSVDDRYVYQLQKTMKLNQFNVVKQTSKSQNVKTTPSVKQRMRKCGNTGNDTFVVWETFPEDGDAAAESREEDFYFSDSD